MQKGQCLSQSTAPQTRIERESFSEELLEINTYALDVFIVRLQAAGEFELADQLTVDSEACGY
jgi:hypothetical protein